MWRVLSSSPSSQLSLKSLKASLKLVSSLEASSLKSHRPSRKSSPKSLAQAHHE